MLDWSVALEVGAKTLLPKVIEAAFAAGSRSFQARKPYAKISFDAHFEFAFEKCTKIKTIINGDSPIDLLHNYVNPNFVISGRVLDEYEFIDRIFSERRVVVTGAAGAGKSMFMRYFWVACVVNPRGKIPIYMELRRFNDADVSDFKVFLYHTAVNTSQQDVFALFDSTISDGQYIFILDGFDELKEAKKKIVEQFILEVSQTKNITIVSSRPDNSLQSWQNFHVCKMMPLTLAQSIELIKRIEYDKDVKKKFLSQLKKDLYIRHKSFASRPLLLTMMLLTFSSYADIPEKIHVFYGQAFETLFARHDATKEVFQRERRTSYSIDQFRKCLEAFCLISYNANKTEFSETEMLSFIRKSGDIEKEAIAAVDFLADLLGAVPVLQREGLNIVFSHRSFQEYFCACALTRLSEEQVAELIPRFATRPTDSVLTMLVDMNSQLVKRVYLRPRLDEYVNLTQVTEPEVSFPGIMKSLGIKVFFRVVHYTSGKNYTMIMQYMPREHWFSALRAVSKQIGELTSAAESPIDSLEINTFHIRQDYKKFERSVFPKLNLRNKSQLEVLADFTAQSFSVSYPLSKKTKSRELTQTEAELLISSMNASYFGKQVVAEHTEMRSFHKNLITEHNADERTFDVILGIASR